MKTKKFNHNKIEKCRISKKNIDTENENYSVILDCVRDTINSVGFYKTEVLKDLIKGKGKVIEKGFIERQQDMINQILGTNQFNQMFNNILGNKKEVYEVANKH